MKKYSSVFILIEFKNILQKLIIENKKLSFRTIISDSYDIHNLEY